MKKRFFYTLIACVAVVSQTVVLAGIPIVPSDNTGAGAKWYRIKNVRATEKGLASYMKAPATGTDIIMADVDDSDAFLWCFIGTEATGFQIYNKAFLSDGARLIPDLAGYGGYGTTQLAASDIEWNFSWEFRTGVGVYGLATDGEGRSREMIHGLDNGSGAIIFYGNAANPADVDGCAWAFEDASLPIIPSLNTGAGANWYRIKNVRAANKGLQPFVKAPAVGEDILMAEEDDADAFSWCFIGNAVDGYQIYNKAFLENGARLIPDLAGYGGYGTVKLANADTEWDYSWEFRIGAGVYGLATNGEGRSREMIHGMDNGSGVIIFYGNSLNPADIDGCSWIFSNANDPILVDFSTLEALIDESTKQVETDKAKPANVKYGEGITLFEAAIAVAQDMLDNPDATQIEVNTAITALKKARFNYRLAFIDLPFEVSTSDKQVWYKIQNIRRGQAGYLTYDGTGVTATTTTNGDGQLWAFTGDNFTGVDIFNKLSWAAGATLIAPGGGFTIANSSWDGVWKLNRTIFDGAFVYGIANAADYDANFDDSNQYIHTTNPTEGPGSIVFYGLGDPGSLYTFEEFSTAVKEISKDAVIVYAQNGSIYVKGTESKAAIFSLTGGLIAVFDAQKPYAIAKGIYIVKVNGKAYKIVVQ